MMTVNGKRFPAFQVEPAPLRRQTASYQDRLHQATAVARAIRLGIPVGAVLYLGGCAGWQGWQNAHAVAGAEYFHGRVGPAALIYLACGLFGALAVGLAGGFAVSMPLAWFYRMVRARQLRKQFQLLEPQEQAWVLHPLCGAEGEVGTLAGRLIDDLCLDRMPAELLPADPPDGRGTEISAG